MPTLPFGILTSRLLVSTSYKTFTKSHAWNPGVKTLACGPFSPCTATIRPSARDLPPYTRKSWPKCPSGTRTNDVDAIAKSIPSTPMIRSEVSARGPLACCGNNVGPAKAKIAASNRPNSNTVICSLHQKPTVKTAPTIHCLGLCRQVVKIMLEAHGWELLRHLRVLKIVKLNGGWCFGVEAVSAWLT